MATWQVAETIGPKRKLTPEGFLLCLDVPVARTGPMVYRAGEIQGITPTSTGVIIVHRTPEEVFAQEAMNSFEGKPVVVNHPVVNGQIQLLTSDNWRQFAVGSMHNVRRGEGVQDNLLMADLLITDAAAISEVMAGLREVSCGYGADYTQTDTGQATQHTIRGNHLALVKQGRCGHACSIGDSSAMPMTMQERLDAARAERDRKRKEADDAFDTSMASLVTGDNIAMPGPGAQTAADPSGRIIVNVHGGAKGAVDAPPMPGQPAMASAAPAPMPGAAPPATVGGADPMMTQICAKLDQLLALLTGGEEEDGDDDQFQTSSQSSEGEKPDLGSNGEEKVEEKMKAGDQGDLTKAEPSRKVGEPMGKTGTGSGLPGSEKIANDAQGVADSAPFASKHQDVISRAEILVPGKEGPKFNPKARAQVTLDSLCTFRREVLAAAMKDEKISPLIKSVVVGDMAKLDGATIEAMFMGASELVRAARASSKFTTGGGKQYTPTGDRKPPNNVLADMNAKAAQLWARPGANA